MVSYVENCKIYLTAFTFLNTCNTYRFLNCTEEMLEGKVPLTPSALIHLNNYINNILIDGRISAFSTLCKNK